MRCTLTLEGRGLLWEGSTEDPAAKSHPHRGVPKSLGPQQQLHPQVRVGKGLTVGEPLGKFLPSTENEHGSTWAAFREKALDDEQSEWDSATKNQVPDPLIGETDQQREAENSHICQQSLCSIST